VIWSTLVVMALGAAPGALLAQHADSVRAIHLSDFGAHAAAERNVFLRAGEFTLRPAEMPRMESVLEPLSGQGSSVDGWREVPPPHRDNHVVVFDSHRNRVLLCGDWERSTIWSYALDTHAWKELVVANRGPLSLFLACGIYDPVRDRLVVFGGGDNFGYGSDETWALDLRTSTWSQLPAKGLSGRQIMAAVYDAARDRMLVFGGIGNWRTLGHFGTVNDLGILDLAHPDRWQVVPAAASGPLPRYGHALALDAGTDRLVLVGGDTIFEETEGILTKAPTRDTWVAQLSRLGVDDSVAWEPLGGLGPAGEVFTALDTLTHEVLAFSPATPESTWRLSAGPQVEWAAGATPAPRPLPVFGAGIAPLPDGGVLCSAGYRQGHAIGELWRLESPAASAGAPRWSVLVRDVDPPGRFGHRLLFDPRRDAMLATGGFSFYAFVDTYFADVWRLDLAGKEWTQLSDTAGAMPGRIEPAVVLDPFHDRLVLFGGSRYPDYLRDLWQFPLAGGSAWLPLVASGEPPAARWGQSAVFDPLRRRMLIFGGVDTQGSATNEVAVLDLVDTPRWSVLVTSGPAPPARAFHTAVFDPLRDRMLVFGGDGPDGYLVGVWALSLGDAPTWSELIASGPAPSPRSRHAAAFDAEHDRMLVQGGLSGHGDVFTVFGGTYLLSLTDDAEWSVVAGPAPLSRNGAAMAADPSRGGIFLHAGFSDDLSPEADLWQFGTEAADPQRAWLLGAEDMNGRPSLRWNAPGLAGTTVAIEESRDNAAWVQVSTAIVDSEDLVSYLGAPAEPGVNATYRLRVGPGADAAGVVRLPTPPAATVRLYDATPNPAPSDVLVRFSLPVSGAASLGLYDLQGRSVWQQQVGALGAGVHRVVVPRRAAAKAGVYFLRLESAAGVAKGKVVIVR
jgi:hypothetical protein